MQAGHLYVKTVEGSWVQAGHLCATTVEFERRVKNEQRVKKLLKLELAHRGSHLCVDVLKAGEMHEGEVLSFWRLFGFVVLSRRTRPSRG